MLTITAIVPTCDRPVLLERALRSIAAQEFLPTEIIVVDDTGDGHDNVTRRALEIPGLRGVHVVANSNTKGASGARNAGAELATGELLAFLDDDDEWLASYLREVAALFALKDLDVVCTDLLCRFADGLDRFGKSAPDTLAPELFFTRNPGLIGSNVVIRRSLYRDTGGFDESLLTSEDMEFGLRLSLRGDVKYHPLRQRFVRHHEHTAARLCAAQGEAMRAGIRRFYQLHAHRMSEAQRDEFASNVRRFWGIDEHGRLLKIPPTEFVEPLLPALKNWLERCRRSAED
jgi:glycosyltransferase involved in cell wall biosynthesis